MGGRREIFLRGNDGFFDGVPPEARVDAITKGSKNMLYLGTGRLRRYPGWSAAGFTLGTVGSSNPYGFVCAGNPALVTNRGLAAQYRNSFTVFSGEPPGSLYLNSSTAIALTLIPQLILTAGGTPGPLGLPSPPKITDSGVAAPGDYQFKLIDGSGGGGVGNKFKGTRSIAISVFREETRGEGWRSIGSDYIIPTGGMGAITLNLPAPSGGPYPGTLKYKIYSTYEGFPEGPFFYYRTVSAGTANYSWTDADLTPILAPYSQDTTTIQTPSASPGKYGMPPLARFMSVLGAHTIAIGTWEAPLGHLIHPSMYFRAEVFDPDSPVLANPPEPIMGVLEASNDGYLLIVQQNAISALVLTGSARNPVLFRNLYFGIGAMSANQVATVAGEIYLWSEEKGLVRSEGDELSGTFANPIRGFLEGFTSTPILVYDAATDRVILLGSHSNPFGSGAANCGIAYERSLPGDIWSAPFEVSAAPKTRLAYDNKAYMAGAAGGFVKIFPPSGGAGAGSGIAQYMPQDGGNPMHRKTVTGFTVATDAPTVDVAMTKGHSNTVERNHAGIAMTDGHTDLGWLQTLVNNQTAFSARVTVTGGAYSVYGVGLEFLIEPATI